MTISIPTLSTGIPAIDKAFRIACGDFAGNITLFRSRMSGAKEPVIIAGMDYDSPWIRDAAFNTWYAGMLCPDIAKNTLCSVLTRTGDGLVIDDGSNQYWDKIIWAWGAWKYYLYTGDREFIKTALEAIENTLDQLIRGEFDEKDGLFRGGACFQDGIAAYPDKLVSRQRKSGIIDCVYDQPRPEFLAGKGIGLPCKALSTNCLYLAAYEVADHMRKESGLPERWAKESSGLRNHINEKFWNDATGTYRYLLDADDPNPARQEGLGHAFALLFGIAGGNREEKMIRNIHITPQGLPCVWPQYERYGGTKGVYARHSGVIWPQVCVAWCEALARAGYREMAFDEMMKLAEKAARDYIFSEIYHPETGLPYGGIQEDGARGMVEWASCRRQTWCASGFISMVLNVFPGVRYSPSGLAFSPYLPEGTDEISLSDFPYRQSRLNITVRRNTSNRLLINGKESEMIDSEIKGTNDIIINLR